MARNIFDNVTSHKFYKTLMIVIFSHILGCHDQIRSKYSPFINTCCVASTVYHVNFIKIRSQFGTQSAASAFASQ